MNDVYDTTAFVVVSGLCLVASVALPPRSWPVGFRRMIVLAVVARIAGATARLWVVTDYYGKGDALR